MFSDSHKMWHAGVHGLADTWSSEWLVPGGSKLCAPAAPSRTRRRQSGENGAGGGQSGRGWVWQNRCRLNPTRFLGHDPSFRPIWESLPALRMSSLSQADIYLASIIGTSCFRLGKDLYSVPLTFPQIHDLKRGESSPYHCLTDNDDDFPDHDYFLI